ncbi:hypothetical protein BU17DRAFT_67419 [Hysterangium stoloniferum]|nr:hypothetical protein BU17DRAFT_67419 [Hysterangium stoloniferum]
MPLSREQVDALKKAKLILEEARIFDIPSISVNPELQQLQHIFNLHIDPLSHSFSPLLNYYPPPARLFTEEEWQHSKNKTTRQSYASALIEHPIGAIVEYPESGSQPKYSVAHHFHINPKNFIHPKENIQYSLGDVHGSHENVTCYLLRDIHTKEPVSCKQLKTRCRSVKQCSFISTQPHTAGASRQPFDATKEVFLKTLAFFCALQENGCLFNLESDLSSNDYEEDSDQCGSASRNDRNSKAGDLYSVLRDSRACTSKYSTCDGQLIFIRDSNNHSKIQLINWRCEKYGKGYRAHLVLRNLNEFNIGYLEALLCNNKREIQQYEEAASRDGYGPLAPCNFLAAVRDQKELCLKKPYGTEMQMVLGWTGITDPALGDLHPSLANADHAARLIDNLRYLHYPHGTGFEGAKHVYNEHKLIPQDEVYVRCIETHEIQGKGTFQLVVCMFRAMSILLSKTKRPSIDTSFKRLHNWQEFEVEAWFPEYSRSRLYCEEICRGMTGYCAIEHTKALHTLSPYDHLARLYRLCFTHFTRKIGNLKGHVTLPIRAAMMSLYSAEPLPDFEGTLQLIRSGGKKAADWLKDKEAASGFALAGIYQPLSKIPLEIWKASPLTSNGNEQAHRNINRDGIKLTMLAGIMRGMQFDSRCMASLNILCKYGINMRDQQATHFRRAARAIQRSRLVQKRTIESIDEDINILYNEVLSLQTHVETQASVLEYSTGKGKDHERPVKRLRQDSKRLTEMHNNLRKLISRGSGKIGTPGLDEASKPSIAASLTYNQQIQISHPSTISPDSRFSSPTSSCHPQNTLTPTQPPAHRLQAEPEHYNLPTFIIPQDMHLYSPNNSLMHSHHNSPFPFPRVEPEFLAQNSQTYPIAPFTQC